MILRPHSDSRHPKSPGQVPELIRNVGIQLNERVPLRVFAVALSWAHEKKTAPTSEAQRSHFQDS